MGPERLPEFGAVCNAGMYGTGLHCMYLCMYTFALRHVWCTFTISTYACIHLPSGTYGAGVTLACIGKEQEELDTIETKCNTSIKPLPCEFIGLDLS